VLRGLGACSRPSSGNVPPSSMRGRNRVSKGTTASRRGRKTTLLPIKTFAALGITGLRDPAQVRLYRKAWESGAAKVGNDEMLDIKPRGRLELA
jgi:hypothetical protein